MNIFDSTELPKPPEQLGVSDVQARSVVIQFFPGFDGKTSITNWVVEAQVGVLRIGKKSTKFLLQMTPPLLCTT